MKPAEVKRVLEIVEEGLQLTGSELDEYLDRVCGNDSPLRREVLDYLQYDSHLSIFHGTAEESSPALSLPSNSGSRYELQEEIARGGMGVIVRAVDTELHREVAVKILHDSLQGNLSLIRRFVQEAEIGGQLQHPGIAPVYDVGRLPDGRPFIAMKLVKGKTLETLLRSRQDVCEDQAKYLGIFEQVCQAIAFAHSRGVIHRDLKPANVMIGEFGEIQVMDWGLARPLTHEQQSEIQQNDSVEGSADGTASAVTLTNDEGETRVGEVMGTPAYMPPEQALGRTDKTTDVFALGAILCEMLTGLPAGSDLKAAQTRLDNCQFDAKIVELAKTCIARDPASRPQDAEILAARVFAYIEATQAQLEEARLATARAQAIAEVERKRRRITIALAVCCTLAAVIALGSWTWISNQRMIHQQALDQQRNRAQSEAEIALGEAEQLYNSATTAPLPDLDVWRFAREAVTRAESLVHAGSLGSEMTGRVSNLSDKIAIGETEHSLVSAIDSARQEGIEASRYHLVEIPARELRALVSVLRTSGLHPETCPNWAQASQQIRQYSDEVRDEIIGAMDQWLLHATEEQRNWLTKVLQNADQNPWRKSWRMAFVENNETELTRIFRSEEIAHQSSRSTLNASYSARQLIPLEERLLVLQRLRVRHVNDLWINLRLGRILLGKGRKQEALTYYQAALAAHPTAAVHGVIANLAQGQARYLEASAHWREAIRLKPDISEYHACLGENLMHAYRYDEAISAFRQAIGLSPAGCNYVINLAGVLSDETVSKLPNDQRQEWEIAWREIDALFTANRRATSKRRGFN